MINLSSFIRFHALRTPDRVAVSYDGLQVSYRELSERVSSTAGWLAGRGISQGDVVAVLMKNSAAFIEIAIAVGHLGAVFLPINFRLSADEVDYIIRDSGARLLIADEELSASTGGPAPVLLLDTAAQADTRRLGKGEAPVEIVPRKPDDLFRLMYTSGTTDRPKGVMHSYSNFYWKCSDHILALGLSAETKLLVVGPLYHVGAFDLPGLAVLWVGGMLHIIRDFSAQAVLSAIANERLDSAWMAPVMTGAVLAEAPGCGLDLSSLRWVIGGGERTPESRIRAFGNCFPNGRYIDGYGLTETCSGDTLMEAGREIEKIGSVGRRLAHIEITIRDESGRVLPPGVTGEICLRGPKITCGYWNDPAKTKNAFYGEWFRSGDMGHLDADGFLFLTDRLKDMIISGGENIASSEVERVVFELPQVRDVAVVGVPDERWGEKPVAVIVLEPDATLTFDELSRHCRARLAAFKTPKEMVLRPEMPRNPSGKILKRLLREELGS